MYIFEMVMNCTMNVWRLIATSRHVSFLSSEFATNRVIDFDIDIRTPPLPRIYSSPLIRVNSFRSFAVIVEDGWRRFSIMDFANPFQRSVEQEWSPARWLAKSLVTLTPTVSSQMSTLTARVLAHLHVYYVIEGRVWIKCSRKTWQVSRW